MKEIDVAIAVLLHDSRILIGQRRHGDSFAGLWEFPGGKREAGESLEQAVIRELREELAIEARVVESIPSIEHQYPNVRVRLCPFWCELVAGDPKPLASQQLIWIEPSDMGNYAFPQANASLIRWLIEHPGPNLEINSERESPKLARMTARDR
jgi:A/G-specific adenine glycosylase